ncbi:MAG: DoxX family protein, partial [Bacteriovoracaceae bacterium]
MLIVLTIINALAFIFYGFLCTFTNHMISEFTRYKLLKFRRLTGVLELSGGLGTLIGLAYYIHLVIFSCTGLALLMILGIIVRVRVGDPIKSIIP